MFNEQLVYDQCAVLFVFNFLNRIYNLYRDLHTRIILINALKVTLDIVNLFFSKRAAARVSIMNLYIIFVF